MVGPDRQLKAVSSVAAAATAAAGDKRTGTQHVSASRLETTGPPELISSYKLQHKKAESLLHSTTNSQHN